MTQTFAAHVPGRFLMVAAPPPPYRRPDATRPASPCTPPHAGLPESVSTCAIHAHRLLFYESAAAWRSRASPHARLKSASVHMRLATWLSSVAASKPMRKRIVGSWLGPLARSPGQAARWSLSRP